MTTYSIGRSVERAEAPSAVALRLADQLDISRGDLVAAAGTVPAVVREADVVVCWLAEQPLRPGARVLVKHGTRTVRATVAVLRERLDVAAMQVVPVGADGAQLNDLVRVGLVLAEPLPLEDCAASRELGSLLVIDPHDGTTLAAGMVGAGLRA